jgi:hypothetical protein
MEEIISFIEIHRQLKEVYGDEVATGKHVWCRKFENSWKDIRDDKLTGCLNR